MAGAAGGWRTAEGGGAPARGAAFHREGSRHLLADVGVGVREVHERDALRLLARRDPLGGGDRALLPRVAEPAEVAEEEALQVLERADDAAVVAAARHRARGERREEDRAERHEEEVGHLQQVRRERGEGGLGDLGLGVHHHLRHLLDDPLLLLGVGHRDVRERADRTRREHLLVVRHEREHQRAERRVVPRDLARVVAGEGAEGAAEHALLGRRRLLRLQQLLELREGKVRVLAPHRDDDRREQRALVRVGLLLLREQQREELLAVRRERLHVGAHKLGGQAAEVLAHQLRAFPPRLLGAAEEERQQRLALLVDVKRERADAGHPQHERPARDRVLRLARPLGDDVVDRGVRVRVLLGEPRELRLERVPLGVHLRAGGRAAEVSSEREGGGGGGVGGGGEGGGRRRAPRRRRPS